jgi:uncharacterized membrane protein required for colicin V production
MSVPDSLYTIDVLFGLFVILFGVAGLFRGLVGELARLITFIFLVCGFAVFFPSLTQLAARHWNTFPPVAIQVLVGIILWLSSILVFFALRFLLNKLFFERLSALANKLCGALMGMLSGALLGLCVLSIVSLVPHETSYRMLSEKSIVGSWVCESLTPWLHPRVLELPVFNGENAE